MTRQDAARPSKNGLKAKNRPRSERLRHSDLVIRRFVFNQPNGGLGLHPGWFRNTFSGQEYEQLRAHILLWRRGRVCFDDSEDAMPACKSNDGRKPSPVIESPKSDACGHWNCNGWFVPECPLAAWRFHNGRRCPPPCQETWSLLGVLEDDGMPFWISLKGTSLRPTRQFLSMCHEVTRGGRHELLDCGITLSSQLAQGRSFNYYVVRFSDPRWLARSDAEHRKLKRMLNRFGRADIQSTFNAEQSDSQTPALAG